MKSMDIPIEPREVPRLSPSIAKILLDKSPKHAHAAHRLLGNAPKPEPSPSTLLGKAVDALVFGTVSVKVKNKGETYDDTDIVLTPAPYMTALGVAGSVRAAIDSKWGRSLGGKPQHRVEWNSMGVQCSGVIDLYWVNGIVVELKTAHDLSDAGIVKAIELYRYDLQLCGAYNESVTELYGVSKPELLFLFAETAAPYDTRWITPDSRMIGNGTADWLRAVTLWKQCLDSGVWPGRGNATLGPSRWKEDKQRAEAWLNSSQQ
jgi:hypothetical protein